MGPNFCRIFVSGLEFLSYFWKRVGVLSYFCKRVGVSVVFLLAGQNFCRIFVSEAEHGADETETLIMQELARSVFGMCYTLLSNSVDGPQACQPGPVKATNSGKIH